MSREWKDAWAGGTHSNKTLNRYFPVNSSEECLQCYHDIDSCQATEVSAVPAGGAGGRGGHPKELRTDFALYSDIKKDGNHSRCFICANDLLILLLKREAWKVNDRL